MRTAHRYRRQNRILCSRRIHQVLENLRHGVVLRVPPRQYHAELVAADAEARPVIPIRAADAAGNRPQAGVAHQVPMAVVDVLEAVNVSPSVCSTMSLENFDIISAPQLMVIQSILTVGRKS